MPDTILEQNWLCHDLKETNIKLHELQREFSTFEVQKGVSIELIENLQDKLRSGNAERNSLKTIVEQQAGALSSDRKRRKGSFTVSEAVFGISVLQHRFCQNLRFVVPMRHQSSVLSQTLRNTGGRLAATLLQTPGSLPWVAQLSRTLAIPCYPLTDTKCHPSKMILSFWNKLFKERWTALPE